MPVDRISVQVSAADQGARLDRFLAAALVQAGRDISRRRIRQLITAGAVYLDRKRVRIVSRPVTRGSRVDVYLEEAATPPSGFVVGPQHVLFEDAYLLALDKPSGLASQATVADAVDNLYAAAGRFLAARDGERDPYLALLHRLDRGTSGVMLFSKSRAANAGLAAAFAGQRVRKLYRALVARPPGDGPPGGDPPAAWSVSGQLARQRLAGGGTPRMIQVEGGGQPAATDFRTLERFPAVAYVEAVPHTGRMHQIRVHLAGSGCPVLGDRLYGPPPGSAPPAPRMMLHAMSLAFTHPVTGEDLCIESPLPEDFRQLLAAVGRREEKAVQETID